MYSNFNLVLNPPTVHDELMWIVKQPLRSFLMRAGFRPLVVCGIPIKMPLGRGFFWITEATKGGHEAGHF